MVLWVEPITITIRGVSLRPQWCRNGGRWCLFKILWVVLHGFSYDTSHSSDVQPDNLSWSSAPLTGEWKQHRPPEIEHQRLNKTTSRYIAGLSCSYGCPTQSWLVHIIFTMDLYGIVIITSRWDTISQALFQCVSVWYARWHLWIGTQVPQTFVGGSTRDCIRRQHWYSQQRHQFHGARHKLLACLCQRNLVWFSKASPREIITICLYSWITGSGDPTHFPSLATPVQFYGEFIDHCVHCHTNTSTGWWYSWISLGY